MASKRKGYLYLGVTCDIVRRVWEHRNGVSDGFSKRKNCHHLVWFETHDDIREAIRREKQIKKWKRIWKLNLIEAQNPEWCDLAKVLIASPYQRHPDLVTPGERQ